MKSLARTLTFSAAVGVVAASAFSGSAAVATNFELVGHNPLFSRGMNAAPALYDHTVYVGSRTDGTHPNAAVLAVDVSDPANPVVVGQIGPPDEGLPSITSRELRVWPQQKLLLVMNFQCSAALHACASPADVAGSAVSNISFYDLSDQARPVKVATYTPTRTPHEMFLWVDPADPARALLYMSTPTSSITQPNLIVTDISKAREGQFPELVRWAGNAAFPADVRTENDVRLHSVGVSVDGTRTYLAYLGGGFLVLDTSELAQGKSQPKVTLVTPVSQRVPSLTTVGTHSAVKVPGRALVLTTDEVYGDSLDALGDHGCPWGWVGIVDISDQAKPKLVGQYRLPENSTTYCQSTDPLNTSFTSYASHNPTLVGDVAFVTWHSSGLQAFSLASPGAPVQTGVFMPDPLPAVTTEDPALSLGTSRVVAWSYPIIRDGLIYMVDLRNGLYVLRYTGAGAARVANVGFLEGNSNLGDAARLETSVLGSRRTHTSPAVSKKKPLPATGLGNLAVPGLALLLTAGAVAHRVKTLHSGTTERRKDT